MAFRPFGDLSAQKGRLFCPTDFSNTAIAIPYRVLKPTRCAVYLHTCFRGLLERCSHLGWTSNGAQAQPTKNPGSSLRILEFRDFDGGSRVQGVCYSHSMFTSGLVSYP